MPGLEQEDPKGAMDAEGSNMENKIPRLSPPSSPSPFPFIPDPFSNADGSHPHSQFSKQADEEDKTPPTSVASSNVASPSDEPNGLPLCESSSPSSIDNPGDRPSPKSTLTAFNQQETRDIARGHGVALQIPREGAAPAYVSQTERPRRQAAIKAEQTIRDMEIQSVQDWQHAAKERASSSSSLACSNSQINCARSRKRSNTDESSSASLSASPSSSSFGIVNVPRNDPGIMAVETVAPDEPTPLLRLSDERLLAMQQKLEDLSNSTSGRETLLNAMLKKSSCKVEKITRESSKKEGCRVKHTKANDTMVCQYCSKAYTWADSARTCEKNHHAAQSKLLQAKMEEPGNEDKTPVLNCLFCTWNTTLRGTRRSGSTLAETREKRPRKLEQATTVQRSAGQSTKESTKRSAKKPRKRRPKTPLERAMHALNQHYENEHDHRPYISPCPGGPRFCKARHDNYVKHIQTVYRRVEAFLAHEAVAETRQKRQRVEPPTKLMMAQENVDVVTELETPPSSNAEESESKTSSFEDQEEVESFNEVLSDDDLDWLSEEEGDAMFIYGDMLTGDDDDFQPDRGGVLHLGLIFQANHSDDL